VTEASNKAVQRTRTALFIHARRGAVLGAGARVR